MALAMPDGPRSGLRSGPKTVSIASQLTIAIAALLVLAVSAGSALAGSGLPPYSPPPIPRVVPAALASWLPVKPTNVIGPSSSFVAGTALAGATSNVKVDRNLLDVFTAKYSASFVANVTYVDCAYGSDANTGLIGAPVASIHIGLEKGRTSVIVYGESSCVYAPWISEDIDPHGTTPYVIQGIGNPVIETVGDDLTALTWTQFSTSCCTFQASLTSTHTLARVLSTQMLGPDGLPLPLTKQASAAAVDAAKWGWNLSGSSGAWTLTVSLNLPTTAAVFTSTLSKTLQGIYTNNDSDATAPGEVRLEGMAVYMSGFKFLGTHPWCLADDTHSGASDCYFENIDFRYSSDQGITVDGSNLQIANSFITRAAFDNVGLHQTTHPACSNGLAINLVSTLAGDFETFGTANGQSQNNWSNHECGLSAVFGGNFWGSVGPSIAEAGTGTSWLVGVWSHDPHSSAALGNAANIQVLESRTMLLDTVATTGSELGNPANDVQCNSATAAVLKTFRLASRIAPQIGTGCTLSVLSPFSPDS